MNKKGKDKRQAKTKAVVEVECVAGSGRPVAVVVG